MRNRGLSEADLGTELPQDYKDFCRLFGVGAVLEFMTIYVPRTRIPYLRLEYQVRAVCKAFAHDEDLAFPLWPDPQGLLPIGGTDNGDQLFWLAIGAPSDWSIVLWDRGMGEFEAFDCDLTDFLAGVITGEILPREFPEELDEAEYLFKPTGLQ